MIIHRGEILLQYQKKLTEPHVHFYYSFASKLEGERNVQVPLLVKNEDLIP